MARKKKGELPSGNVRIQVYDYTDVNGKRHYKSFTAPTRREAQLMAAEWKANPHPETSVRNLKVYDAIERYIETKKSVLSPSTVRGYEGLKRNYFSGWFGRELLDDLSSQTVQLWISDLAAKVSPKTVRNAYGLLASALDMFHPDLTLRIQLPARKKPDLYTPNDEDIRKLLNHIKGTELELAVLLAAFGPLRRGEICALEHSDIKGNTITISKSMVLDSDGSWKIKQPKTYGSYRKIEMPDFVIAKIPKGKGLIFSATPDRISGRFTRAVKYSHLPHFRFHDLRHYSASIMHAIGIPDQYIMQRGGWSSDNVMKTVYRNVIDLEKERQNIKIIEKFDAFKSI